MPLNIGSNLARTRSAFGPAVLALGAAGTTPTSNIGLISSDNPIEIEFATEFGEVRQGNPMLAEFRYVTSQDFYLRCPSIEWSANRLAYALGTGATSIDANNEIMTFGGDPCPFNVALHLQHVKCLAAHTINVRVWTAQSENGGFAIQFGQQTHEFAYAWKAMRSTTDWAGATLATDAQLVQVDIQLQ